MATIDEVERHLPDYAIDVVLGTGTTSTVYRAIQRSLGRYVAIKSFSPDPGIPAKTLAALEAEAALWAHLRHENLIHLLDYRVVKETRYMILEYAHGFTLRDLLDRHGALPDRVCIAIAYQTSQALEYLHRYSIVHRDIKPANLYITSEGVVKLTDFGISLCPELEASFVFKSAGSPAYMHSSDIAESGSDTGIDLYSFGIVFLEMWKGEHPDGHHWKRTIHRWVKGIDSILVRKIIRECLQPRAKDRGSTRSKRQRLERFLARHSRKSSRELIHDFLVGAGNIVPPMRLFPRKVADKVSGPLRETFRGFQAGSNTRSSR